MNNYINDAMWDAIEKALMDAEVPYRVTFDSHVNEAMDTVTYDKRIIVEPFIIQKEKKI